MKTKILILLLAMLTVGLYAEAQFTFGRGSTRRRPDTGPKPKNVHGVVQDIRGNPLPGVRVFIRNVKTNVTRTVTVDEKGMYAVYALPPDVDYEVTADFKGQASPKKFVSSFL